MQPRRIKTSLYSLTPDTRPSAQVLVAYFRHSALAKSSALKVFP